ncbi:MAG: hypothetical protein J3Q66DRAFT_391483 [Benniella sp.]|nr:MAG: hypothetical protein J3Q66DRAFT_391483 [Benniella sp.]
MVLSEKSSNASSWSFGLRISFFQSKIPSSRSVNDMKGCSTRNKLASCSKLDDLPLKDESRERVAHQWRECPEKNYKFIVDNKENLDRQLPTYSQTYPGRGKPRQFDWTIKYLCRRQPGRRQLTVKRDSVGNGCPAYIRIQKVVGEVKVTVEYHRRHNHDNSTESRAGLPTGTNERHWINEKASSGHDWRHIKNELLSSDEDLQSRSESVPPSYLVKYDDVRRALYRKHRKEFTRHNNAVTSAECWMKEIEQRGGKGWCNDRIDNNPKTYLIAWCTRFQLQVVKDDSLVACMDSTRGIAKPLKPETDEKEICLFTILVKDRVVRKDIPIAHMLCSSESSQSCISDLFHPFLIPMDSENSPDSKPSELGKAVPETPGTVRIEELAAGHEENHNACNTTKSTAPNVMPPELTASPMETIRPSLLISSNSTGGHPLYNWELLPKKELERIAYNSRKQRKARLRENPPSCVFCPDVRLTSMAMLSTHLLSKKHCAHVKRQASIDQNCCSHISHGEISEGSGSFSIAPSTPATPQTIDDTVKYNHQQDTKHAERSELGQSDSLSEFAISANKECTHDRNSTMADGRAMSDKSNIIANGSAKQRRRKAERDRKKARARLTGKTDQIKRDILEVRNLRQPGLNQNPQEREAINDSNPTTLCSKDYERHEACLPMHFEKSRSHAVLPLDDHLRMDIQKNTLIPRSDIPTLTSGVPATSTINEHTSTTTSTTNGGIKETVGAQSRSTRLCSICGSSWKTMKCWQGHLLSAQHSRHMLRTMRLTAPLIPPCGKMSVLASMDPFGWGAGTGVMETDENEDSPMNVDKKDDQNIQAVAYQ